MDCCSTKKEGEVVKIETPPMDFRKAVALRAIHGKAATPALPGSAKKILSTGKKPAPPRFVFDFLQGFKRGVVSLCTPALA